MKLEIRDAEEMTNRVLQSWGICAEESKSITENLIEAELVQRKTHGLVTLPLIKHSIEQGTLNLANDQIAVIRESPVSLLIDGMRRSGFYVIGRALDLASAKIGNSGLVIVGLSNTAPSTGLVGLYARKATERNLIFICFSNCEGGLVPFGLKAAIWGTNPFTVGIPTKDVPVILDMASTRVNWGKIFLAQLEGKDIEYGIAIDKDGHITTNPHEALEGGILPFAEHKGSGLAFIIELLAGALTRSRVGYSVPGGWGTLFILIDPRLFGPIEEFQANTEAFIQEMKSAERMPGFGEVYYPGERSQELRQETLSLGFIDISDDLHHMLASQDKAYNEE